MKKIVSLILATLLAATLLAACGSSTTTGSTPAGSAPAATGAAVKLTYGLWDQKQLPAVQKMIDTYVAQNPNVSIETQVTAYKGGEYWTKLEASMTGGTAPDVFWINALHVESYVDGGMLLSLDDAIAANGLSTSDFPEALVSMYNIGGSQYAVPKDFDTNAVWYNKELFDKAGVAYPSNDWTWEEMVETARKMNDPANGVYGIAAPLDFQTCYYNTVFGAGGWILNEDKTATGYNDPKTQKGIQCWIDLIDEGLSPSLADMTDTSADAMFESGMVAMIWAGSYMTPEYVGNDVIKGKTDLVEAPAFEGTKANVINGLGYAVYVDSKNKEEATKFATWLGGAEAMKIQGEAGAVISARNDAQGYFAQAYPDMNMAAYTNQAALSTALPVCKISAQLYDTEASYLKLAYSGETNLADACSQAAEACDALLAKMN